MHPGTPLADCHLEVCEPGDLQGDKWEIECSGFSLFVDTYSAPFLEGADIDYECGAAGGQLTIRAPCLRGIPPWAVLRRGTHYQPELI
jgi:Fe/S biogenesis protein NfuA